MGSIPRWLLRQHATVEAYRGAGPVGDVYDPPVVVACRVALQRQLDRTGVDDVATAASTVVYLPPGTFVPVGSRVTVAGRAATVTAVDVHDAGPGAPNHVKVTLT